MKYLYTALLLLVALPVFAKDMRVGVLYWSMNIPGQVAMRHGLEAEAARIDAQAPALGKPTVTLETRVAGDGEEGIRNQIRQMQELIGSRVDVLVVQPTDNAALSGPLRAANQAGIPVVAFDQYISGGALAAYRTSDNYQAGYLDGEYITAHFPGDWKIRLVLVEYPHVSSTVERVDGFLDALQQLHRKYAVIGRYSAVESVGGRKAAADILKDFPDPGSIDVVFAVNDGGGLPVIQGLLAAGRKSITFATVDGDPDSVENIRSGKVTGIDSAQFCGPLGAEAMKAAYALLLGESPPPQALMPVFPVTRETLGAYPGWMGPIPPSFAKPWPSNQPIWSDKLRIVNSRAHGD